jgi:23S rRNA U2552 (ribose-2'-O)-methylase RlmE/FtsJ
MFCNISGKVGANVSLDFEGDTILFEGIHDKLNRAKNKIDSLSSKLWNSKKKLANPFEMISSNYTKGGFRVCYKPLSRSYFKLWEILKTKGVFDNAEQGAPCVSACLAEGPGGFMEAIANYREDTRDRIVGITLPITDSKIPGWEKFEKGSLVSKNEYVGSNFEIEYGDLYKLGDILRYRERILELGGADLVTADGGFDFSSGYNEQETQAQRLIFSEIVTAFSVQKEGGSFVCKVFDLFSTITVKMLYLVCIYYEEVSLVKPKVSRPANSERYIVAKGFRGIDDEELKSFYDILVRWSSSKGVKDIAGIEISDENFLRLLEEHNEKFSKAQIDSIQKTIDLSQYKVSKIDFDSILLLQKMNAKRWCKKHNVKFVCD